MSRPDARTAAQLDRLLIAIETAVALARVPAIVTVHHEVRGGLGAAGRLLAAFASRGVIDGLNGARIETAVGVLDAAGMGQTANLVSVEARDETVELVFAVWPEMHAALG